MIDVFNKSIDYSLIDFSLKKGENKETKKESVTLEIDLNKALDKTKLVQKRVPVRGNNGKVHYRMQWVKPSQTELSKNSTKSQAQTHENSQNLPSSSLGDYSKSDKLASLKSYIQKVNSSPEEGEYIDSILTSSYSTEDKEKAVQDYMNRRQKARYKQEDKIKKDTYNESIQTNIENSGIQGISELRGFLGDCNKVLKKGAFADFSNLESLKKITDKHLNTIRSLVKKDLPSSDTFVQNVQKAVLNKDVKENFESIGIHPKVLKFSLLSSLGEEKYKYLKSMLTESNLTINTSEESLEGIFKNGYKGLDAYKYIEKSTRNNPKMQDFCLRAYEQILEKSQNKNFDLEDYIHTISETYRSKYKKSRNKPMGGADIWANVAERFTAEKDAMCLSFSDRKPCYIAFNPTGSTKGGAPDYGNSVIEVNPKILSECTCTSADSFLSHEAVPLVYNKDHLEDLFILKQCELEGSNIGNTDNWIKILNDIPLEIQYHKPTIKPEYLSVYSKGGK